MSLWGEIEDCTVKCKFNEPIEGEIKIVFVPQVIVRSMSYFQVVELFCRLYEYTPYGNAVKETINRLLGEENNVKDKTLPKEKMLLLMEKIAIYIGHCIAQIFYISAYMLESNLNSF